MIIAKINPVENIKPIIPGRFNRLSKQGLDAIAGKIQNKNPGEYLKK